MKRLIALLMAVGMLGGALAGCGGEQKDEGSTAATTIITPIQIKDGLFDMTAEHFIENVNGLAKFECVAPIESWEMHDDVLAVLDKDDIKISIIRTSEDVGASAVLVEWMAVSNEPLASVTFDNICDFASMACGGVEYTDEGSGDVLAMLLDARRGDNVVGVTVGNALCSITIDSDKETFMIIPNQ